MFITFMYVVNTMSTIKNGLIFKFSFKILPFSSLLIAPIFFQMAMEQMELWTLEPIIVISLCKWLPKDWFEGWENSIDYQFPTFRFPEYSLIEISLR